MLSSAVHTGGRDSRYDAQEPISCNWCTANNLTISGTVNNALGYNAASQIIDQSRSNDTYSWTGAVAVNRAYTANGLNQYSAAGAAGFTYDANGNLITEPGVTYVYDIENRLVSASGARTATLAYDPMGRLFQLIGTSTNNRFLYDGDELVAEYDSAGTMARRYVHSDNVDDPVVEYAGAGVGAAARTFLMPDERGSIAGRFSNAGTTVAKNSYDEYGIPGAANAGRFQYTGQIWLPELGMYHYKARIYSPTLGRFLQTDPIGYDGGIALYAYVGNDPINMVDPDGKLMCCYESMDPKRDQVTQMARSTMQSGRQSKQSIGARLNSAKQSIGAVKDMGVNYVTMRSVNTIGADKYYHCLANCQATARGPAGEEVARQVSEAREQLDQAKGDPASASAADQVANSTGRQAGREARRLGGDTDRVCKATCSTLGPSGQPAKADPPPKPPILFEDMPRL